MHLRKAIRNRVVAILKDAHIPRVENNVFSFRNRDVEEDELPVIEVYTMSENGDKFNEAPRRHDRNVDLVIEIRDSSSEDDGSLADNVDDLCNDVEKAILDDPFLGTWKDTVFCIEDTVYSGTQYSIDNESEAYLMMAQITFTVNYKSNDSIDANDLEDLKRIAYNIKPAPGTIGDDEAFTGVVEYED